MKRKHGLLKKAAELSILCGLKVSLVFSDIQPNIFHVFSNDCPYKVDYENFLKDNFIKEKSTFNEYSIFDYPFESMTDQESKIVVDPPKDKQETELLMGKAHQFETEKKETSLKKREPLRSGNKGGSNVKATSQVPIVLTFDATDKMMIIPKMMENEGPIQRKMSGSELQSFKYKFLGLEGLSQDQKCQAENFIADLDIKLLSHFEDVENKGQPDEESINLLIGRTFLLRYFGFSQENKQEDHMTYLMRSLIDFGSMLSCIQSIRELSVSTDQYSLKLRQLSNVLINALVNPFGFEVGSLTSLRAGKPIFPLVGFLIRSLLQQIRLLDSMHSGEKTAYGELGAFISSENFQYVEVLIASAFNIISSQRGKTFFKSTPIKKNVFNVKSENSNNDPHLPREIKPHHLFGTSQEKFLERDRSLDLLSVFQ